MFKLSADRITSVLVTNELIEEKEFRVYSYGFELIIAFAANALTVLLIGLIFGKFVHTLLFLLTYCPIRQYAGGFHAKNYSRCLLTFATIYLVTILTINYIDLEVYQIPIMIGLAVSLIGICILSPVEHRNNPLSNAERIHHKKVAARLSLIIFTVNVASISFGILTNYFIFSAFALYWIFIMLVLAIVTNRRTS
ncbi:accessory gene regulator ArgB-like protein [Metaclostridioides mangenotii]|jgi:accessory gene regulator B|uniref:accessory gene regulator ArgB-like protein n=1 Tax=Metaclostridioides mangenotii TaxID=1540 RepID=UPI000484D47A|nr:accessory gene regulator B family protein [Clostridioides mangenotii]